MRIFVLVVMAMFGPIALAEARCADELKELSARVELQQKRNPTAQSAAAAKELRRASRDQQTMDELECYNTVARARRALAAPPPETAAEK